MQVTIDVENNIFSNGQLHRKSPENKEPKYIQNILEDIEYAYIYIVLIRQL